MPLRIRPLRNVNKEKTTVIHSHKLILQDDPQQHIIMSSNKTSVHLLFFSLHVCHHLFHLPRHFFLCLHLPVPVQTLSLAFLGHPSVAIDGCMCVLFLRLLWRALLPSFRLNEEQVCCEITSDLASLIILLLMMRKPVARVHKSKQSILFLEGAYVSLYLFTCVRFSLQREELELELRPRRRDRWEVKLHTCREDSTGTTLLLNNCLVRFPPSLCLALSFFALCYYVVSSRAEQPLCLPRLKTV